MNPVLTNVHSRLRVLTEFGLSFDGHLLMGESCNLKTKRDLRNSLSLHFIIKEDGLYDLSNIIGVITIHQ